MSVDMGEMDRRCEQQPRHRSLGHTYGTPRLAFRSSHMVGRSWAGLGSAVRRQGSALRRFARIKSHLHHTRRGGQEYQYEIKDRLIRVSRPWFIDHPLRKVETMSGGVKVLPCESGKVVGTRPREQGAFPVIRHFIWRNQTNTDAVKCRWAETRLFGVNIPVWMYRPVKPVTKEPLFSNLGAISVRRPRCRDRTRISAWT